MSSNITQIFHAFLFNIGNYSPELGDIQRREAEFNIIFPRVNNFGINIKHIGMEFLFYYIPLAPNKILSEY